MSEQQPKDDTRFRRQAFELARLKELKERGYEEFDRGYEEFDRGYEEFDRGYEEFDRGYEEFDRGYEEFDRGRFAADPERVARNAFRSAMGLGGHFVVAFVTPIGRPPGTPRAGNGLRSPLSYLRYMRGRRMPPKPGGKRPK